MHEQLQKNTEIGTLRPSRINSRVLAAICVLLLIAGVLIVTSLRSPAPMLPSIVLLPNGIPSQRPSLFARWVPFSWSWLWRLKDFVIRHKPILLETVGIDCRAFSNQALTDLSLGKPLYNTNNLQIWIMSDQNLKSLRTLLESERNPVLFLPRMQIADGIQGAIFSGASGPRAAGVSVNFLPRVRRGFTDLSATILITEALTNSTVGPRTNMAFSARMQVPKGSGVFVLSADAPTNSQTRLGLIISASVPAHR